MESESAPKFRRCAQGLDHGHGTGGAAVQAARLVHAHPAGPGQAGSLDLGLAPVKGLLGTMLRTAGLTIGALVDAKEDVALEVAGHGLDGFAHARYFRKHGCAAKRAPVHTPASHKARASPATGPGHRNG